jgi:hypothetical protein
MGAMAKRDADAIRQNRLFGMSRLRYESYLIVQRSLAENLWVRATTARDLGISLRSLRMYLKDMRFIGLEILDSPFEHEKHSLSRSNKKSG